MDLQDVFAAWAADAAAAKPADAATAAAGVARAPSFSLRADCCAAAPPAPAPFCARPGAATTASAGASDATAVAVGGASPVRAARRARAPPPPASPAAARPGRARTASTPSSSSRPSGAAVVPGYDFATVYAFLGSLFDPACSCVDPAAALAQMAAPDRDVALIFARSLAAHLRSPPAMAAAAAALAEGAAADEAGAGRR